MKNFGLMILVMLLLCGFSRYSFATSQPPGQPPSGPGGSEYAFQNVKKNFYGEGYESFWIFEPQDPTPSIAPVIVFNHGWGATNPRSYGAWIDHLVRRGNIVIYPSYQIPGKFRYDTHKVTQNAVQAVIKALDRLRVDDHVRPDLSKFAIVGHSAGAQITANMAALAPSAGLPLPKAFMSIQPGKSWNQKDKRNIPLENLSAVPASVLLLVTVGDKDSIVKDIDGKRIFLETTQVPLENKDFVTMVSDEHGKPELLADHFSPVAGHEAYDSGEGPKRFFWNWWAKEKFQPDALDYYGYWKLFDGLCDAAFQGKNQNFALGNTHQQKFMGKWSDGTPVHELVVTKTP